MLKLKQLLADKKTAVVGGTSSSTAASPAAAAGGKIGRQSIIDVSVLFLQLWFRMNFYSLSPFHSRFGFSSLKRKGLTRQLMLAQQHHQRKQSYA